MMPAKKRPSQSKHTPPASPAASTSHAMSDQHHHLRHTGPSISSRSRVSAASAKSAPALLHPEPVSESSPAQKDTHEKASQSQSEVSSSGARTSFKFMYVLLFVVLLLFGWYIYGMITLSEGLKEEVGWWGIVVGDTRMKRWGFGTDRSRGAGAARISELEGSLNALADALGIPVVEVASAVKPLISQESLTNIAPKVHDTGGSEALRVLLEDTMRSDEEGNVGEGDGAEQSSAI